MDKGGRIIGMIVFAVGIVVMLFVFGVAYGMFTSGASELIATKGGSAFLAVTGLGNSAVLIMVKIALLFVMTLTGSLIASRGIELYLGSGRHLLPKRVEGLAETGRSKPTEAEDKVTAGIS